MKMLLKVSIVFIALSFFYFFKPVNKSSQNFLSLSEAEKIEKNIYNDFKKEIIVTRSDEMEDQVIKLKDKIATISGSDDMARFPITSLLSQSMSIHGVKLRSTPTDPSSSEIDAPRK